jgi:hypothetical protein
MIQLSIPTFIYFPIANFLCFDFFGEKNGTFFFLHLPIIVTNIGSYCMQEKDTHHPLDDFWDVKSIINSNSPTDG